MSSGLITEVHKSSKFIHGTAVLFPDMVQSVPYWIDDESLRPSIQACAPEAKPVAAG
jgi:SPX domain protein involved in polyphosphate accumulation